MRHEIEREHVLFFDVIDARHLALVGGKGAHLGALSRMGDDTGIRVPPGFCVTTHAFDQIFAGAAPAIDEILDRLSGVKADEREAIAALSAEARRAIEGVPIPTDIAQAITHALERLDHLHASYAVRSSATAEDLPNASFAGQHDTYLNVIGAESVLTHVRKCWASLFTERAVSYRVRSGFDQRKVRMAVVVQAMVNPYAAGVLFTAHPVSGNRKVSSIEACFGLGEALVSGHVNPDVYEARDFAVVSKSIGHKERSQTVLNDAQILRLTELGRKIEAHFGAPQDIEWCLATGGAAGDEEVFIVQSRPITTLFPLPANSSDGENHVYLSVGHQQMMTDAMKPLGLSFWKLIASGPMHEAANRFFVDVTRALASPASRSGLMDLVGKSDPLTHDALKKILGRKDFIRELPVDAQTPGGRFPLAPSPLIDANEELVHDLLARTEAALAKLKRDITTKTGVALFDFIQADIQETKRILTDAQSMQVVMGGIRATWWLNDQLPAWLGETARKMKAADTLAQSVPHNVTSEMGLALLDVADVIRPHAEVVAFLKSQNAKLDDDFLSHEAFGKLSGGPEARDAINAWLDKYGARCPGEIDITRPRFRERPTMLLPTLISNIEMFGPGEGKRRFERGREEAEKMEVEILRRLRALPNDEGGEEKAAETKLMIDRVRAFMGYREYPKFGMVSRMFVYKQALLEEAERLVAAKVLEDKDDIFFLMFDELHEIARTGQPPPDLAQIIRERKESYAVHCALTPPRVLTSEGESVVGSYNRDIDLPPGALIGLAVSAGTVEGRARVILDIAKADLAPGDILVTRFTDPSWTPLFVPIKGLVTEIGGHMTHGAVIAREYGLPAVVGVENATTRIRDGQRIRVNGSVGFVEILLN